MVSDVSPASPVLSVIESVSSGSTEDDSLYDPDFKLQDEDLDSSSDENQDCDVIEGRQGPVKTTKMNVKRKRKRRER